MSSLQDPLVSSLFRRSVTKSRGEPTLRGCFREDVCFLQRSQFGSDFFCQTFAKSPPFIWFFTTRLSVSLSRIFLPQCSIINFYSHDLMDVYHRTLFDAGAASFSCQSMAWRGCGCRSSSCQLLHDQYEPEVAVEAVVQLLPAQPKMEAAGAAWLSCS